VQGNSSVLQNDFENPPCGNLRPPKANAFGDDALSRIFCKHMPLFSRMMLPDAASFDVPAWLRSRFIQDADGIWRGRGREDEPVSYLEGGHALCFECEERSFWFGHRNRCVCALLQRYPPAGALFDIGGGNGIVSRALRDAGWDVVLVEPGAIGARNAARRGIATVVCATLRSAHFPDAALPAVGLFDVLEHIADDEEFLRECRRVLVPRGRLYLTVPAFRWLWSDDDVQAGHFRRYALNEVETLLRKTGFRPLAATFLFSFLPAPLFLLRSVPSFFGRRKLNREKYAGLHRVKRPGVRAWIERAELRRIERGEKIRFGTSCLLAAERID
jgi:SAM-dependent methyltransferase